MSISFPSTLTIMCTKVLKFYTACQTQMFGWIEDGALFLTGSLIQVDIGGHPPFPNGSKQFLAILAIYYF